MGNIRRWFLGLLFILIVLPGYSQEVEYTINSNASGQVLNCSGDCYSFDGTTKYIKENDLPPGWFVGANYQLGTDGFGTGCPDIGHFYVTDPGNIVQPSVHLLTYGTGNHPQFSGNAVLRLQRNPNKIGKFSVRTVYEDKKINFFQHCTSNFYNYGSKSFCILAPPSGATFGRTGSYDPANISTSQSFGNATVKAETDGSAKISLFWENDVTNYCNEVFYDWSQGSPGGTRMRLVNGPGTYANCNSCYSSSTYITSTKFNNKNHQVYSSGWYYEVSMTGTYVFEIEVKDRYGNIYKGQQITVNVVPSCYGEVPAVLTVSSSNTNPTDNGTVEVINGGSGNPLGGYRVEKDKIYQVDLVERDGAMIIPTDFCTHYDIKVDDGFSSLGGGSASTDVCNTGINFSNAVMDFSYAGVPGRYNVKIKQPIGSFRIYAKKKDYLSTYCYNYQPMEFFVGGQNEIAYSPCLMVLPRDINALFPDIKTDFGTSYVFHHFTYEVVSGSGIIFTDDDPDGEGGVLQDGALLRIESKYEQPLAELVDNDKTWAQTWVYDDEGRVIGESKQFFDSRGRPTQNQVKNLTSSVVLGNQNIYDKYGRPAVSTLAAPVRASESTAIYKECGSEMQPGQDMYFIYRGDFVTGPDKKSYKYEHIDSYTPVAGTAVSKLGNPDPLDNEVPGTLGWYYGDHNIAGADVDEGKGEYKFIEPHVATTGYPYRRTVYDEDGTNMTLGITLPGDVNKMGTGHLGTSTYVGLTTADNARLTTYLELRRDYFYGGSLPTLTDNYYKVESTDANGNVVSSYYSRQDQELFSMNETTGDKIYQFYDVAGRLVCAVTPNGLAEYLLTPTPATWLVIEKTTYLYNHRGWLLEKNEVDAGITRYKYRKDGSIRFSQNSLQEGSGKYSYSHYDRSGRIVESGEYDPSSGGVAWSGITSAILEATVNTSTDNGGLAGGSKSEVVTTVYDKVDASYPGSLVQEFTMGSISYTYRDNGTKSWYSYDERGRIIWVSHQLPGLSGIKTTEYQYTPAGDVKQVSYQGNTSESFYHAYVYDADTRLKKVYTSTAVPVYDAEGIPTNMIEHASYEYYLHGSMKRMVLAEGLQGLDYTYTPEGSLKSINHYDKTKDPGSDGQDAFGLVLDYYTGDYVKTGVELGSIDATGYPDYHSGLIKASTWFSQKPASSSVSASPVAYAYNYNDRYELSGATWGSNTSNAFVSAGNTYKESGLTYDPNGNIQTLIRYGSSTSTPLHDFEYNYATHTNRLTSVYNNTTSGNYATYQYDAIGQLSSSTKGGITSYAIHDVRGMMTEVAEQSNGNDPVVKSFYDNNIWRYKKETYKADHTLYYTTYYVRDAIGQIVAVYDDKAVPNTYARVEAPVYGTDRLGMLEGTTYLYELKDHVGSVRSVVYSDVAASSDISFSDDFEADNSGQYHVAGSYTTMRSTEKPFQGGYSLKVQSTSTVPVKRIQVKPGAVVEVSVRCWAPVPGHITGPSNCDVFVVDQNGDPLKENVSAPPYSFTLDHHVYSKWDLNSVSFTIPTTLVTSTGTAADANNIYVLITFHTYTYLTPTYFDDLSVKVDHKYPQGLAAHVATYTDYYPYGLELRREGDPYRYAYQGEYAEKDGETELNAFQLRMYDAVIGRWLGVDPYREFYSVYMGMGNNPVSNVDPDGGKINDDIHIDSQTGQRTVIKTKDDFDRFFVDGKYMGYICKSDFGGIVLQGLNGSEAGKPVAMGKVNTNYVASVSNNYSGGTSNEFVQEYGYVFYSSSTYGLSDPEFAPKGKHHVGYIEDPKDVLSFGGNLKKDLFGRYGKNISKAMERIGKLWGSEGPPTVIKTDTTQRTDRFIHYSDSMSNGEVWKGAIPVRPK
jgi:RHS repeat-associated protein